MDRKWKNAVMSLEEGSVRSDPTARDPLYRMNCSGTYSPISNEETDRALLVSCRTSRVQNENEIRFG